MIIIIARFNESLEWAKELQNVIVYNKGAPLKNPLWNEFFLENVGREGHTYYKYIYDNYDNLDDYTMFLQGNPFDHSPNLLKNIGSLTYNFDFKFISEKVLPCNLSGCRYHIGLPLVKVYKQLFDSDTKDLKFEFGAGAQFIVSKETIHRRPREFYLKIVKLLEHSINPIEGFVIERFHKLIFLG